ncbi:MAG TPA: type II secretion system F family protein [Bryobacteraceae bacterium]|nr:type II secretion system F family protein [Bryobacteraceae bacterium]
MSPLFFFLFFVLLAIVLVATAVGLNFLESQRKKQVRSLLRTVEGKGSEAETQILLEPTDRETYVARAASHFDWAQGLETTLQQSGLNWSLTRLLAFTLLSAGVGLLVGWRLNILLFSLLSLVAMAIAFGSLPYLYVRYKRHRRFSDFEEQFPEALDFLARSMRAGHAFSISLEMLGEESPEPLGQEFRTLFNEQNLGAPIDVALANMERRLPLVDVRFFISSVMLQKQTGGNLSEILTRLAYVIRERFRLKGQVKAASAHGRLTATILTLMPIALMFGLLVVAPGYLEGMAKDPDGKWMIVAAILAQCVGYYFIRKIIRIKI